MHHPRTVAVGVDFSPLGELALAAAADLAERTGAERLHLVHVVPDPPVWAVLSPPPMAIPPLDAAWAQSLAQKNERLRASQIPARVAEVTHEVRTGGAARELVRAVAEVKAELLVVAARRRSGVGRVVFGSVASALLRASPCPVLVVGADRPGRAPFERVLAAIDTSPVAEKVLTHAMALAASATGVVQVLSVHEVHGLVDVLEGAPSGWPKDMTMSDVLDALDTAHRARITELVERARAPDVRVEVDTVSGGVPAHVVLERVKTARPDLIVIGTSGHGAWKRFFLGSTALEVVAEAPCPVLVVPAGD